MKTLKWKIVFIIFISMLLLLLPKVVFAAPVENKIIETQNSYTDEKGQKKDCTIKVSVTGDEFYTKVKSLDGYTLIRDPETNSICYAVLNDQGEFISSKTPYTGLDTNNEKTFKKIMKKDITENKDAIQKKANKNKQLLEHNNTQSVPTMPDAFNSAPATLPAPTSASIVPATASSIEPAASASSTLAVAGTSQYSGNIVGLTILIKFPDVNSNYTQTQIQNFCNGTGYTEFGNNGSVRQYFSDMSGGKLNYTNTVTAYYTAKYNRSYYTDPSISYGTRAQELITEALQYLGQTGFDFSTLSKDANGRVRALNVFYVGDATNLWAEGLWPHQWNLNSVTINGTVFYNYEISDMPAAGMKISTFCHENGHMTLDLPDMYDYTYYSYGLGVYDLMASGYGTNPSPINPYFRYILGWGNTEINFPTGIKTINANQIGTQMIQVSSNEMFCMENVQATGRWSNFGTSGLYIWHVDRSETEGNRYGRSNGHHYMVSLEQADGKFDLEYGQNRGDSGDAYRSGYVTSFTPATTPNSNLWTGQSSELSITNISAAGSTMQYTYNGSIKPIVTIQTDKTYYKQGDKATITATFNKPVNDGTPKITLSGVASVPLTAMTKVSTTVYTYVYTVPAVNGTETITISGAADSAGVIMNNDSAAIIIDSTLPTVSISKPNLSLVSNTPSVSYTVTYADTNFDDSTLSAANVTLNKTGTANGTVAVTGDYTTYTVTISGTTGTGTIRNKHSSWYSNRFSRKCSTSNRTKCYI